jgi:hypothetical protein
MIFKICRDTATACESEWENILRRNTNTLFVVDRDEVWQEGEDGERIVKVGRPTRYIPEMEPFEVRKRGNGYVIRSEALCLHFDLDFPIHFYRQGRSL